MAPIFRNGTSSAPIPAENIKSALPEDSGTALWFFPMLKAVEQVFQVAFGDDHHAELMLNAEGIPTDQWVLRWRNYELIVHPGSDQAVAGAILLGGKPIKRNNFIHDPAALCDLVMEIAVDLIRRTSQLAFREFERTRNI